MSARSFIINEGANTRNFSITQDGEERTFTVNTGVGPAGADAVITNASIGAVLTAATAKTTPVDADTMPLTDSAASNALKKVTWANIKATLASYFGTVYAALVHTHVSADITDATSAATANKLVLRDATGGAFFGDINVATVTSDGDIKISGETGVIWTEGSGGNIYTIAGHIQSGSTFKLYDGASTTTLSHSPTANRAIAFPNASGTLALTTSNVATATALATSRNIFGLAFDGTANVSGDATNTGHFASIPTGGAAGHFVMLQGTAPTVVAGRTAIYGATGGFGIKDGTGTARTVSLSGDLSLANNLTTSGNFALTLTTTASTSVTLPTSGTLATLTGSETLTNKTLTSPTITTPSFTRATSGQVFGATGSLTESVTFTTDTAGRAFFTVSGNPSATGSAGGSYVTAQGVQEGWMYVNATGNTTGLRVMRFGNLSNRFSIQRLNDTNSSITATPFSMANDAPSNAFYMNSSGGVSIGTTTDAGATNMLVAGTTTSTGKFIAGAAVKLKGYTVATLPTGTVGDTAYVTDALAPTFLATLVGGGAITTKAFYNGTNWVAQ